MTLTKTQYLYSAKTSGNTIFVTGHSDDEGATCDVGPYSQAGNVSVVVGGGGVMGKGSRQPVAQEPRQFTREFTEHLVDAQGPPPYGSNWRDEGWIGR